MSTECEQEALGEEARNQHDNFDHCQGCQAAYQSREGVPT
jgi:hypothetical protein